MPLGIFDLREVLPRWNFLDPTKFSLSWNFDQQEIAHQLESWKDKDHKLNLLQQEFVTIQFCVFTKAAKDLEGQEGQW